ncbi:MAG: hypothetical protein IMF05_10020 [Proteobacteria bacterium]|nr:hypothetical protein [Pseudomonadota bacterium]
MNDRFGWGAIASMARACCKALGFLFLGIATFVVAGCMEIETVVRVNADGSGTITERLVMSNEIVEMMKEMAPEGQPVELFNEQELLDAAPGYGEGVTYVSAKNVEAEFGKGYEASYAFTDINKIRVGQDPGEKMPGAGEMEGEAEEGDFTTFTMQPGYPAQLVIHWPVDQNEPETVESTEEVSVEENTAEQTSEEQEAAMEMMKMAFKDMRMSMHVEVAGQIVDSNATHLNGNRVTLIEIAFAEFLDSEEAMTAMASNNDQTVADMKEMMRLIPGLKMEIEPEVSVQFE